MVGAGTIGAPGEQGQIVHEVDESKKGRQDLKYRPNPSTSVSTATLGRQTPISLRPMSNTRAPMAEADVENRAMLGHVRLVPSSLGLLNLAVRSAYLHQDTTDDEPIGFETRHSRVKAQRH